MYSVTHSEPAVDGLLSILGGAAVGGAAGAAVMAYFFSKDRGNVVCYTNVKLAGHGERGCHEFCVLRDNSRPRRALPTRQHAKQDPTQTYS